ncbi:hypothetical protein PRUB_a0110 [Pseudoalteromonas rubra]|uniref:Uncharacterized protein n=1 Tax=Pseudoalteromonas rubra TaxID=43658 RepID=A0A8T0C4Q6_9GAMM|nr:hypothetical protein [Pseudoalteromonas rubra]KAF7785737.1 hypothetical protein PRUB_a0110 [Pseudoalteromonas rubra]
MQINLNDVLADMADSMNTELVAGGAEMGQFALQALQEKEASIRELYMALQTGELSPSELDEELKREMLVFEVEALSLQTMNKVMWAKAINAAAGALIKVAMPV